MIPASSTASAHASKPFLYFDMVREFPCRSTALRDGTNAAPSRSPLRGREIAVMDNGVGMSGEQL